MRDNERPDPINVLRGIIAAHVPAGEAFTIAMQQLERLAQSVLPPRTLPLEGQLYCDARIGDDYDPDVPARTLTTDITQANLVTSHVAGQPGTHRPVLDIDVPAWLVPSSTPGHSHLYIDKTMTWEKYCTLLGYLARAEILETGYVNASLERGHTAVRLPWVTK